MTRAEMRVEMRRVHKVARATGARAYAFSRHDDGLIEVRVHPDGKATVRPVDEAGQPTGKARKVRFWTSP